MAPRNTYFSEDRDVEVRFSHPALDTLTLGIKPDSINWSYQLNTANFPTYGGEVVQILSCNFGDMTISGMTRSYRKLEQIYTWFVEYIQIATQEGGFDQRPVKFEYLERQWVFDIIPKQVPGFKYGRDVVAPTWTVVAEVVEPDVLYERTLVDDLTVKYMEGQKIDWFGKSTAEIGYDTDDPFRTPTNQSYKKGHGRDQQGKLTDFFTSLIPAWAGGDFEALSANYSRPAFLTNVPAPGVSPSTKDNTNESEKPGR